jgi:hypothetical protein
MHQHFRYLMNVFKIVVPVLFVSSMVFATADGPDFLDVRGVEKDDELAIHLEPAESSRVTGKIPYNTTCLKNLGCTDNGNWWCKVAYQKMTGWVNGQFLKESGDCQLFSDTDTHPKTRINVHEIFSSQLLEGKTLYTQGKDGFVKVSFSKSKSKSFDGTIVFSFLGTASCRPDTVEALNFRIESGKIIYYGNDGSKNRLTLQAVHSTSWVVLEEEDTDGDDSQFGFGPAVKKVYKFDDICKTKQPDV